MNIKKTLSKVLACSLVLASTLAVSTSSTRANAAEVKVLICPEVDIQKMTLYCGSSNKYAPKGYNDLIIFFKNQSRYYGYFFNGVTSMGGDSKNGVTAEMWQHRPSNSK